MILGSSDSTDKSSLCSDFQLIYLLIHQTFIRTQGVPGMIKDAGNGKQNCSREPWFLSPHCKVHSQNPLMCYYSENFPRLSNTHSWMFYLFYCPNTFGVGPAISTSWQQGITMCPEHWPGERATKGLHDGRRAVRWWGEGRGGSYLHSHPEPQLPCLCVEGVIPGWKSFSPPSPLFLRWLKRTIRVRLLLRWWAGGCL